MQSTDRASAPLGLPRLQRWRRYPLFLQLLATLGVIGAAAAMLFWGGLELQQLFASGLDTLARTCADSGAAGDSLCTSIRGLQRSWQERQALMLLLQGGCLALIAAGALLLVSGARSALVRRPDAALSLLAPRSSLRAGDEIDRLVANLRELAGRQAGFEAEGRWLQQASADLLRARTRSLESLCRVARLLGENEISELHLASALGLFEQTLGARTAGLRLTPAACAALGSHEIVSTHRPPDVLREAQVLALAAQSEVTARLLPVAGRIEGGAAADEAQGRTLVVPVCQGGLAVGILAADLGAQAEGAAPLDDSALQFAESFAHLLGVAMSSAIRSHEDRRVALLEERSAIAGELHDSLAQSLAFMKIQVARLQHSLEGTTAPASAVEAVRELRDGLTGAYREVRELIATFRIQVSHGGVANALQQIAAEFSERNSLPISVDHRLGGCRLGINQEFHLLQIVREAVTNTVRHAQARHVWIGLACDADQRMHLKIEDDGRGLTAPDSEEAHYGLSIMRERARSLGGELAVGPREGGGTCVSVSFVPDALAPQDTQTSARNGS